MYNLQDTILPAHIQEFEFYILTKTNHAKPWQEETPAQETKQKQWMRKLDMKTQISKNTHTTINLQWEGSIFGGFSFFFFTLKYAYCTMPLDIYLCFSHIFILISFFTNYYKMTDLSLQNFCHWHHNFCNSFNS